MMILGIPATRDYEATGAVNLGLFQRTDNPNMLGYFGLKKTDHERIMQ